MSRAVECAGPRPHKLWQGGRCAFCPSGSGPHPIADYTRKFEPASTGDIASLVAAYPLASVISGGPGGHGVTQVPLLARTGADRAVTRLVGHMARSNPQLTDLVPDGAATVVFNGPDAYVSPSWFADRAQAPTWIYARVEFHVRMTPFDAPDAIAAHLDELTRTMEARAAGDWHIGELRHRYEGLARAVVGFEADVVETRARFKLCQDERGDVLRDILSALAAQGRTDIRDLVARANKDRLPDFNHEEDTP